MKQFIVFAFLIVATTLQAQAPKIGQINGSVTDASSQEPVAYATITIKNVTDSTTVTGGLTDESGSFSIKEIPFGEYLVDVSFIGYDGKQFGPLAITKEQFVHNLGAIALGEDANVIGEAVVEAEAPAVRYEVDKKVYDASKIKSAEGGTAKDVLEQIPSVTVSSDQSIQLRGSGNVRVLVNGRPSNFSMNTILQQIPQKNIKDIEIITNPSAKYDAEGEVGIINIILKDNDMQGLTGGLNASWGTENKWNTGANVAYRVNKWNLTGSYNFNRFKDDFFRDNLRILKTAPDEQQISDENRDFERNGHFARFGVDYYVDDANTFFFSGSMNKGSGLNLGNVNSQNIYTSLFNGSEDIPLDYYNYTRLQDGTNDRDGYELTGSYQRVFGGKQSHNLLLDVSYSDGDEVESNQFSINNFVNQSGDIVAGFTDADRRGRNSNNLKISADYTNPFDGKKKLELGYRSTLDESNEDFTVRYNNVIDARSTGVFKFEQNVHAGYVTYQQQVTEKIGLKGGLRTEFTDISSVATGGQDASYVDDYFSFFPTASASYQVSDKLQLSTSYSRRISRPHNRQLNPFADRTDQNNIFVGNNELRPQFSDNYELGFNQFWGPVSLDGSLYHRFVKDQIQFKNSYNVEQNVNEVSFFNLAEQRVYGAEASLDIKPKGVKWYSVRLSGNYNYSNITRNDDQDFDVSTSEFQLFSGNIANNFRFDNGWNGQLNLNYQGPFAGYVGELNAMYGINANVSKQILDKKGTIFVRANDVFNTFGLDVNIDNDTRYQSFQLDWPSQMAFVGFNYNFGQLKQPARRKMERREEQGDDNQPTMGM